MGPRVELGSVLAMEDQMEEVGVCLVEVLVD